MNQYDVFVFQSKLDNLNLPKQKQKWKSEDLQLIFNHLNIPKNLLEKISTLKLNGEKLFTQQYNTKSIINTLSELINETTLFPIKKLQQILNFIIDGQQCQLLSPKDNKYFNTNLQLSSRDSSMINRQSFIEYRSEIIRKFTKAFDNFQNNNSKYVIGMNIQEISSVMMEADVSITTIQLFRKHNIDGFCLICVSSQDQFLLELRNYLNEDSIQLIKYYSGLFLLMYMREMAKNQILSPNVSKDDSLDTLPVLERKISIEKRKQSQKYEISTDQIIKGLQKSGNKSTEESNTQFNDNGYSEEYMVQQSRGSQVYGQSIAGSIVYSQIGMNESQTSFHGVFVSSIEQIQNIKQIKNAAKNVDFNLLNLEPLVQMKIQRLPNPFSISFNDINTANIYMVKKQTSQSNAYENNEQKIFSLEGAKFGRDGNNDFCFPDQLSISSKHAQIFFSGEGFELRDLGSKQGTFLRIKQPVILQDQMCIQLSQDVEFTVRILKKQQKEGTIKIEFIKPDRFPTYQAYIKQDGYLKIGRAQTCQIRIDESRTTIASKHADIKYSNNNFWFVDRKSQKGSWIRLSKKSKVSEGYKLKKGDIFRISTKKSYIVEDIKLLQTE